MEEAAIEAASIPRNDTHFSLSEAGFEGHQASMVFGVHSHDLLRIDKPGVDIVSQGTWDFGSQHRDVHVIDDDWRLGHLVCTYVEC